MGDTKRLQDEQADADATDQVRQGLERAEVGDKAGAKEVEEASAVNPPAAEAAEQEASDGSKGRGLAR
jgi:hypothetical protein